MAAALAATGALVVGAGGTAAQGRQTDPTIEAIDALQSLAIRHLPVVDDENNLVGMLSDRDLGSLMRTSEEADAEGMVLPLSHTAIDLGGQRATAVDRLYLAAQIPTMILWGDRDPMIPLKHGVDAHAAIPGSRLVVFPGAGHFPHLDSPLRFVRELTAFMRTTTPARLSALQFGEVVRLRGNLTTAEAN
jgi:pimeloyl-ACP methyl ester carboxylesterase